MGLKRFLKSIILIFIPSISSEPSVPNESTCKLSWSYIKKLGRKDVKEIRKAKFKKLAKRWCARLKNFHLIIIIAALAIRKIFGPIFSYIDSKIFERKVYVRKTQLKSYYSSNKINFETLLPSVSVVINTKNSPSFFKEILHKYKNQIGFKKIEIIIVDSGSTDDTLKLAKYYGCKIIEIKPEDFHHGRSRNIGIEAATGKYIVNAVSDATPSTLDLLAKAALKLENNRAGAVSVRQIPRMDADIFAAWNIWNHYQSLFKGSLQDAWVSDVRNFKSLSNWQKRKLTILDDVFILHKAPVIKKNKYNPDIRFAEDIELSIRYIEQGITIGFLNSECIIHSHNRNPEYFFKRYFIDSNVLYDSLNILQTNVKKFRVSSDTKDVYSTLYSLLGMGRRKLSEVGSETEWIGRYQEFFDEKFITDEIVIRIWKKTFRNLRLDFRRFADSAGDNLEQKRELESKIAAVTSAILLSEFLLRLPTDIKNTPGLQKFKAYIEKGV
jgi:glycosyltransferase involved in cell wall biosynthesis